ncbi:MAG: glutamate synthase-related protein, partial [Deltaproteobacteria bacterium]
MNLRVPNANEATGTFNRSKNVVPMSGLCSRCVDGCKGSCEIWLSSFRGREVIYPIGFGEMTAGADKDYPIDYSHLSIQGYAVGAKGLPKGVVAGPDTAVFPAVNTETEYGWKKKVKMRIPIFTGALGSTEIARVNWEHFATGAAIAGVTIVCGENVCGIDPGLERGKDGLVKKSPEMDRRIESYKRYHEGYGEILVQMNVEDTRLGVAEYVQSKHGLDTIELKWGQGAKNIGGEIKVKSLERALELKKRGYIVLPDPTVPEIQAAFKSGAIKEFERHSRLGFVTKDAFVKEVKRLRKIGFSRITLKTGAYSAVELALAIRLSAEAQIDLLTIDGAPGGTGMSPWPMMCEWGIPTFYLQCLTYKFCEILRKKKIRVPDIAIAGGFASEDGVFKALAMGSPYVKAVCMGRALMIPGMVGKNIGEWLKNNSLPKTVSAYG